MLPIMPNFSVPEHREVKHPVEGNVDVSQLKNGIVKVTTAAACGVLEVSSTHPVDTITRRLMTNRDPVRSLNALNNVVFQNVSESPLRVRAAGLRSGSELATTHTVCKRAYKFGTQPLIEGALKDRFGSEFCSVFEGKTADVMLSGTAGSICGAGEVAFLPIETLKVQSQVNPSGLVNEPIGVPLSRMYRGALWCVGRNVPGSFALFAGNTAVQSVLRLNTPDSDPTLAQQAAGSVAGGAGNAVITNPTDVIKTRLQVTSYSEEVTGRQIAKDLIRQEGFGGFFRGIGPRLLITGPKLAVTMTLAQYLHQKFSTPTTQDASGCVDLPEPDLGDSPNANT